MGVKSVHSQLLRPPRLFLSPPLIDMLKLSGYFYHRQRPLDSLFWPYVLKRWRRTLGTVFKWAFWLCVSTLASSTSWNGTAVLSLRRSFSFSPLGPSTWSLTLIGISLRYSPSAFNLAKFMWPAFHILYSILQLSSSCTKPSDLWSTIWLLELILQLSFVQNSILDFCFSALSLYDPSEGSPTETLLRLLLPLKDTVWMASRPTQAMLNPSLESYPSSTITVSDILQTTTTSAV